MHTMAHPLQYTAQTRESSSSSTTTTTGSGSGSGLESGEVKSVRGQEGGTEKDTEAQVVPVQTRTTASSTEPTEKDDLPQLHFTFRWSSVLSYIAFLIFCNLLIPCLLFYLLRNFTSMTEKEVIGISSAALGLSSCFDAPFRLYRLARYRFYYGPLGSDTWWHLDFVMWTYTFALFVFAPPSAIAPAIPLYLNQPTNQHPPSNFFLMSTPLLVLPIGIVFFYSLLEPILPVRCSSEPSGNPMKPAVFYVVKDVGSVDFKLGRGWRGVMHDRYRVSPSFRSLMRLLTLYWTLSTLVYTGVIAAVTWASPLQFAFGWVLGQFFLWAGVSALGCVWITRRGLRREWIWFEAGGRGEVGRVREMREVEKRDGGSEKCKGRERVVRGDGEKN
ncbi:hypothetical protein BDQ17DRAFT_1546223 [Cyathus striatus]|nr:hypothetical protein BDQ17DRAFT_1546223 [Cyathus striatus]